MDHDDDAAFEELVRLAQKTKDPSLTFLSAAWATRCKKPHAATLAQAYLELKDPNINVDKRTNYLKKQHALA
jgi:hypothetical protein